MVHASVTYLTTIARVGCGLRKRKSEELIGTVEVIKKNKIMTGKIEEKKAMDDAEENKLNYSDCFPYMQH